MDAVYKTHFEAYRVLQLNDEGVPAVDWKIYKTDCQNSFVTIYCYKILDILFVLKIYIHLSGNNARISVPIITKYTTDFYRYLFITHKYI